VTRRQNGMWEGGGRYEKGRRTALKFGVSRKWARAQLEQGWEALLTTDSIHSKAEIRCVDTDAKGLTGRKKGA